MKKDIIFVGASVVVTIAIVFGYLSCFSDSAYKDLVINNSGKMRQELEQNDIYVIDSLDGYFTKITISEIGDDSSCILTFCGDRNSNWWWLRKDKQIVVDIPYSIYMGRNTDKDMELIKAITLKRKKIK